MSQETRCFLKAEPRAARSIGHIGLAAAAASDCRMEHLGPF